MSKEQIEKFLEQLNSNVELQEELKSAPTAVAVADIAKNLGFDVTAGDVLEFQEGVTAELSDSQLENISGGVALVIQCGLKIFGIWATTAALTGGVAYGINNLTKD